MARCRAGNGNGNRDARAARCRDWLRRTVKLEMMHATFATARPAELNAKQLFRIFPTPMFTGVLSELGICDRIERKLRELQRSGEGYPSPNQDILAYMTPDDLQNLPEMKELVDVIMLEA